MGVEAVEKPKFFIELRIFDRPLFPEGDVHRLLHVISRFLGRYGKALQCFQSLIAKRFPRFKISFPIFV
jgi:hypothetical protein